MLDNTAAGGIPLGYSAWDSMVKEFMEEASLSEDMVVPNLKPAGAISYFYQYVSFFAVLISLTLLLLQNFEGMASAGSPVGRLDSFHGSG
jgi:hypothetical protein